MSAVLALVLAVLLLLLALRLSASGDAELRLGDEVFEVGDARQLARTVAAGGPLGFKDPLGRGRDIWLQHSGGKRWRAFEATYGDCRWTLDRARKALRDSCTGEVLATGDALPAGTRTYPTTVDDDGALVVDLRRATTVP